jgi:Protein of unknown function (DUF3313)
MHRPVLWRALCSAALYVTLGGSAPALANGTLPDSSVQASGFLGDYAGLAKVLGRFDTWQWVRPGVDWMAYDKLLVPPVEVWINPQAAYPGIVPDVYKRITDNFRGVLIDTLRDRVPIKLAMDVARSATGTDKTVIVVSGEVEALDGVSGQRLFAQVTTRKDAHLFVGQNLSWDDVRDGATEWANQARARLDAARAGQR